MELRKYVGRALAVFIFSLALQQTASAALRPSALTLSPMVGAHLFSSEQNLDDAAAYGVGIGYNFTEKLAAEAIFTYVATATSSGVKDDVDYTSLRLDLLYHFPLTERFSPYLAIGGGEAIVSPDTLASDTDLIVGYGVGAKYFLNDTLALRCDVRHLLDINDADTQRDSSVVNNFAASAGISLQFGGRETVKRAPEEKTPVVNEPVAKAPVERIDNDGDGVPDNLDLCPGTATDVVVDRKGCAVAVDKDQDGVIDGLDACPDTPTGTVVDAHGCPAHVALVAPVAKLPQPALTFYLEYLPNEVEVSTAFAPETQRMTDFIKANPGRRFIIEGHTDSVGNEVANMKLSLLRAEKIKDYLVEKMGVPSVLLEARGIGERNPVADNSTQEGRRQNRRIVIISLPQ